MTVTDHVEADRDLEAFRRRVRAFLDEHAPQPAPRRDDGAGGPVGASPLAPAGEDAVARAQRFQALLFDAGLAGITWPVEYGGRGLSQAHQRVFNEEVAGREVPTGIYTIGHGMCGPTILEHGTEEQKQRYIRPMLRGEEIWCQLFSEPGAGSDVASLQSRAVRDGDEYVLSGQKVWTSGAHYCHYGIVIARTDPDQPKHRGISMFIVDMKAPGVTVRPLRQITGGSNFNEVFFDDVRIPADHLVGGLNEGWRASITMLMNERVAIGAGGAGRNRGTGGVTPYVRAARERGLDRDPVIRQGLAELYTRQQIQGYIGMRVREAVRTGRAPGPEGSVAKLFGAQLARFASDLGMRIAGTAGVAWEPGDQGAERWSMAVLSAPGSAIAGGTNEIQRNIIGERVLGLPKDPQVDRDVPFRDLKVGTQRSDG